MKFSVLQFFSWPGRRGPIEQVFARAIERIELMDRTGYDCVWLAEHHFNTFSVCPSVHLMGAHVAARTRKLRIGTGVSLAALYHPLRLAEEVALLDVLSGGRVNWGAGRGFDPKEFGAFGVEPAESRERFHENVDAVLTAWRNDVASFQGKHVQFEDIELLPKPLQKPHPPVWIAASSPEAIAWAAAEGHDIMMDPHSPHEQIGQKRRYYAEQLRAAGHADEGREVPMARLLAIADTDAEAREVALSGARWTMGAYLRPKGPAARDIQSLEAREASSEPAEDPAVRYVDEVVIHGSPERVADELLRLREEIQLDYLICSVLSHETFLLFTDKVMPRLG